MDVRGWVCSARLVGGVEDIGGLAIRDAVAALDGPVVELHLTNPDAREPFRRKNLLADVVTAGIRVARQSCRNRNSTSDTSKAAWIRVI